MNYDVYSQYVKKKKKKKKWPEILNVPTKTILKVRQITHYIVEIATNYNKICSRWQKVSRSEYTTSINDFLKTLPIFFYRSVINNSKYA